MRAIRTLLCGAAAVLAISTVPGAAKDKKEPSAASKAASEFNKDPYPSTYRPYPGQPVLITGATIYDGKGGRIDRGALLLRDGKVAAVGASAAGFDVPADTLRIDAPGKFVTPGIIDIHSHLGDYPSPAVEAHSDGNEMTDPTTPNVWAEHSVWPQDPGFSRALANGGVTALQILPGSGNLMGGRGVTLKNVPSRTVQGMKFPAAPYSLKMACGENPKRVYGAKGRMPSTRMGNFAVNRETWIKAQEYRRKRDEGKLETRDLKMETLAGVLDGEILIQNHCYRADEMAVMLDVGHEFGYRTTAFHHAVEAYKIADLLATEQTCVATWATRWGFKMEAFDGIEENGAILASHGVCVAIHSDEQRLIQRLNVEAAVALAAGRRAGIAIAQEEAIKWITLNPARIMGIADRTGSLEPGKLADVVLWSRNPFSVYAVAEKVFIEGALVHDTESPGSIYRSDFEVGQPVGVE